ncbi:MAG: hypothetical protein IKM61_07815 [Eubacteriaceae bacterium]|nr:hypothetical protein [Eubacteriaceae bacterium]
MKKLKVISISGQESYVLRDEATKDEYKGDFGFINFDDVPVVGDYIFMSETVCTDKEECLGGVFRSGHYYGPYGNDAVSIRKGRRITDVDFIVLVKEDRTYLLHRYYG